MNLKKILFSLVFGITMVQAMHAEDAIFSLLDDPNALQIYLNENPEAIHEKNSKNQSVLYHALYLNKDPETIQILLDAGAHPNEILMHSDPSIPHRSRTETLLHKLANRYKSSDSAREAQNNTAQQAAWLILYGADDSIPDSSGRTPKQKSPELMMHVNQIIQVEQDREQKALQALFGKELKYNTGMVQTTAGLLGHAAQ